jgi:hypothetical protein
VLSTSSHKFYKCYKVKKMKLAVVVLFCVFQTLLSSQETNNSGFEHICRVSFRFSKVCYFHDFVSDKSIENGCHPTRLKNCPILRTKVNEPKCPVYICEVMIDDNSMKNKSNELIYLLQTYFLFHSVSIF